MPSITTWSRIEPQTSGPDAADVETGYSARVHDPLWLLARQWQVGEFQGEDAGTPIVARWRARVKPMTRFVAGPIPINTQLDAPRFDPASVPLETLVERQVVAEDGLRRAVEDGLHFLRILGAQRMFSDPSDAFVATYAVPDVSDDAPRAARPRDAGVRRPRRRSCPRRPASPRRAGRPGEPAARGGAPDRPG